MQSRSTMRLGFNRRIVSNVAGIGRAIAWRSDRRSMVSNNGAGAAEGTAQATDFRSFSIQQLSDILEKRDGLRDAVKFYEADVLPTIKKSLQQQHQGPSSLASLSLPFTLLLMKVLSDTKRLEDVRLMFALVLREHASPPVDVFNVVLLSISWSDTFTEDEIDNIWHLMEERNVEKDTVSYACFLHLYLRLQRVSFVTENWDTICKSIRDVTSRFMSDPVGHPLPPGLTSKLSHVFATMIRMSPTSEHVWTLFDIIAPITLRLVAHRKKQLQIYQDSRDASHATTKAKAGDNAGIEALLAGDESLMASNSVLTTRILITFLTASLLNAATRASQLRKLFSVFTMQYELERALIQLKSGTSTSASPTSTSGAEAIRVTEPASNPAPLPEITVANSVATPGRASIFSSSGAVSEMNVFRLLARCTQDGDLDFADELIQYAAKHGIFSSPELAASAELAAACCAAAKMHREGCGAELSRCKQEFTSLLIRLEKAALAVGTIGDLARPMTVVLPMTTDRGTESPTVHLTVTQRPAGTLLGKAFVAAHEQCGLQPQHLIESLRDHAAVSGKVTCASLHRVLQFCALSKSFSVASELVDGGRMRDWFQVHPNSESWELLLHVATSCGHDVEAIWDLVTTSLPRQKPPLPLHSSFLSVLLRKCLEAGDIPKSLQVLDMHVAHHVPVDREATTQVVRNLCQLVDTEGVRKVLRIWQSLNGGVDSRVTRMCVAVFRRYNLPHDDLHSYAS